MGTAVCLAHFSVACVSFPSPWQGARNVDFYFGWECQSEKSVYDTLVLVPLGLWWLWQNHLMATREEREEAGNQGSLKVVLSAPKEPLPPTTPPAGE